MNKIKDDKLLSVNDLTIHYFVESGTVKAVNNIGFDLKKGETLGIVGETGAGKTTIALGIMGLIPDPPGKIVSGSIIFEGEDLLNKSEAQMRDVRGKDISMIFQDPMTALNPIDTVGDQIAEVIHLHEKVTKREAMLKAVEMMELVGIPGDRYSEFPHQFSGGMKQRIVIAIALACNPKLLIADEPTSALDVTIQAQVLEMMNNLKKKFNTSMILITHDLGVVAEMCNRVAVIYAGEIVEIGNLEHIYDEMSHPYTKGLFGSLPSAASGNRSTKRLTPIPGLMPDPTNLSSGCKFAERCPYREDTCEKNEQPLIQISEGHLVRCWKFNHLEEEA
jgi:peptide/nickel transport system ATP-binding protein